MIMTRDQKLRVCRALCVAAHQPAELFSFERGPDSRFLALWRGESECSPGEWVLLALAHAVWVGRRDAGPTAGLMLVLLDSNALDLVGRLLQACGKLDDAELEAWLSAAGFPAGAAS